MADEQAAAMMEELARMRAALEEVRAITAMPLPDPSTHSWRAFYDAAVVRLGHCAETAARGLYAIRTVSAAPSAPVRRIGRPRKR